LGELERKLEKNIQPIPSTTIDTTIASKLDELENLLSGGIRGASQDIRPPAMEVPRGSTQPIGPPSVSL